jgi:hypothetical protein
MTATSWQEAFADPVDTIEVVGPYEIRACPDHYGTTKFWRLVCLAWQSERDGGAWRWQVGRIDIEPDGYHRWHALVDGFAPNEQRARAVAREAAPNATAVYGR